MPIIVVHTWVAKPEADIAPCSEEMEIAIFSGFSYLTVEKIEVTLSASRE